MRLTSLWLAVFLVSLLIAAQASEQCHTYAEARAHWPNDHLWWRTVKHCWTNERHAGRVTRERKTNRAPSREPDGNLTNVHWYARGFDGGAALEPSVIVSVIDYRWPGSNVLFDNDQIMEASR